MFIRHHLQISVIVRIFKTILQGIVIHVGYGLRFYGRDIHRFKLQIRHGSESVPASTSDRS